MGFIRHGQRADTNFTELVDDLVAVQYEGVAQNITFELPDEGTVTRSVVRGRVWTFKKDGTRAEYVGETLIFPTQIAQMLEQKPDDWHLGILRQRTQRGDESRTIYTLEAPEGNPADVFGRMESELTAQGVA